MPVPPAGQALLGRAHERALLADLLSGVRGATGPALMFSGEPGSGKTALLQAAQALSHDLTVVGCRGVEWEAELPFSGLHELLTPLLDHLPALPDPQRAAVERALGVDAGPLHTLHLLAGTLTLLTEAARLRPTLLIVDDLQWVDSASAQVLSFVARRIEGEPLGMLVAARPGTELPGFPSAPTVLGPLDRCAVAALAERLLGRDLPEAAVEDLTVASAGNPLAVVESVGQFGDALRLRGTGLDEPLPVGDLIDRRFAERLASLSPAARGALELVAVSVQDDLATIVAAGQQLDGAGESPRDGLLEAERAGVLGLEGGRAQFSHPLLRSLVHRRASAARRRACHAALAVGASAASGLRAWHAASAITEPHEPTAADLDAAALRYAERGGQRAAAQALARAAELTPDPDRRAARLVRAGIAAKLSGSGAWAESLFLEGERVVVDPIGRLPVGLELAALSNHLVPGQDNPARLLAFAARACGTDDDLAAQALILLAYEGILSGRGEVATEALERMRQLGDWGEPTPEAARGVAAMTAYVAVLTGAERLGSVVHGVLARLASDPTGGAEDAAVIEPLMWLGDHDAAARCCGALVDTARAAGDAFSLSIGLSLEGDLRFRAGDWDGAVAAQREGLAIARATEHTAQSTTPLMMLAPIAAARGDEAALSALPEVESLAREFGLAIAEEYAGAARGLLALGAGRGGEAVGYLERARDWKRAAGQTEPFAGPWPADLVDAYAIAGRPDDAQAALAELRAYADATGRAWARTAVARLTGTLTPGDDYAEPLTLAIELAVAGHDRFAAGRAHLVLGQRLRRDRRRVEAREHLEAALVAFQALGAEPWAEQARRELGASSATLRKGDAFDRDALTPQERQVAGLVATGASNKEVAASMFLSPKTIETHLSRIYRKLGVASRTQLAAKLHTDTP